MKKWIAILLLAAMTLSLAACGNVNDTPVAILWSGEGEVKVPNSLINAMERAMYIEKVSYEHYGANGNLDTQVQQAKQALDSGCSALMVELVFDVASIAAKTIVEAAKAKNVPVVFFNCEVSDEVLASYDKAVLVATDAATKTTVYSQMIVDTLVKENKKFGIIATGTYAFNEDYDRNEDGKITCVPLGLVSLAVVEEVNKLLKEKNLPELEITLTLGLDILDVEFDADKAIERGVELILTDSDPAAQEVLLALQEKGYNSDKLKTHCIPIFTVGNSVDYKALVMKDMPAAPHALDTEDKAEKKAMKKWWGSDEMDEWKRSTRTLCDLSALEWSELNAYLYTTTDVISDGRLAGTTMEDYDAIATTAAAVISNLLTGKAATEGIEGATEKKVLISYTTFNG